MLDSLSLSADEWAELDALRDVQMGAEGLADYILRVSPHRPPPEHIAPLLRLIERTRREEVRALVSMPPRHAKTHTLLHGLAWRTQYDPGCLNAYLSYGAEQAVGESKKGRQLAIEGGVQLSNASSAGDDWRTHFGGGVVATGVGGPLTGKGITGLMIIDDPFKGREDAESEGARQKVWDWFTDVAYTRLQSGSSCIVCATRWHEDDLIGRLDGNTKIGDRWEVINIPAVSDGAGKPLDERLERGARALWSREFGLRKLSKIRLTLGEYGWWSLYQGMPRPRGEGIFKQPATYDPKTFSWHGKRGVIICDPAATAKTTADYSAIVVAAIEGFGMDSRMYIVEVIRLQDTIPKVVAELLRVQRDYKLYIGVEAVGGFKAVPQMLRDADNSLRIVDITPKGDKFTRAQPCAAAWNDDRVLIPGNGFAYRPYAAEESRRWVHWDVAGYLDEMTRFTGVSDVHDDQVDASAHAWTALYRERQPRERGAQPG